MTRATLIDPQQALAGLKQKVKKYNKDFEKAIEKYRENPVESEDEAGDEQDRDGGLIGHMTLDSSHVTVIEHRFRAGWQWGWSRISSS